MTTKTAFIIVSAISLLGTGGYGGYKTGMHYQRHLDELEAVNAEAGHYNQKNAGFVWGPAERIMPPLDLSEVMEPDLQTDPKPAHKPKRGIR